LTYPNLITQKNPKSITTVGVFKFRRYEKGNYILILVSKIPLFTDLLEIHSSLFKSNSKDDFILELG